MLSTGGDTAECDVHAGDGGGTTQVIGFMDRSVTHETGSPGERLGLNRESQQVLKDRAPSNS